MEAATEHLIAGAFLADIKYELDGAKLQSKAAMMRKHAAMIRKLFGMLQFASSIHFFALIVFLLLSR